MAQYADPACKLFEMRYSTIKRDSGPLDEYAREKQSGSKLNLAKEISSTFTKADDDSA